VHFGVWHPISEASAAAPEAAGVLQTRAEGVMDYRSDGAPWCFTPVRRPVRRCAASWLAAAPGTSSGPFHAGARWIRFAATTTPKLDLERLLEGFVERFGSPPISNAGAGRAAAAKSEEGPA
jgi:hypothetical protein